MGRGASRTLSKRLAICGATALLAVGAATAARAQDPVDPPPTPADDTELTPQAKENTRWTLLGGAKYRAGGKLVNDASPTKWDVDFFTNSFSPTYAEGGGNAEGFFGGAECIDPDVPFEDEALRNCKRRPALYRFWVDQVGDERLAKVPTDELVEDSDEEGFVGAVAWIDGDRALAVGGTGTYPRREPSPAGPKDGESHDAAYLRKDKYGEDGSSDKPAGLARAWIYEDPDGDGTKTWREITDELPKDKNKDGTGDEEPMGALTALECLHIVGDQNHPKGTCFAGGLQRIWRWNPKGDDPEGFDPDPVTNLEVPGASTRTAGIDVPGNVLNPTNAPDFHHRVRQIRFGEANAVAVTSGCCVERLQSEPGENGVPENANPALGGRLLTYAPGPRTWKSESLSQWLHGEDVGAATAKLPDSIYAIASSESGRSVPPGQIERYEAYSLSGVASPGGQPAPGTEEPGSRIVSKEAGLTVSTDGEATAPHRALDAVRLLAAGNNSAAPKGSADDAVKGPLLTGTSDSVVDWAVGSLKEGSLEGTAQGVAYTSLDPAPEVPAPMSCPLVVFLQQQGGSCELVRENITDPSLESKRLIGMGTYALNSLSVIFKQKTGWAAGDRGAIARLGGGGKIGSEPEPNAPRLKPGRAKPLAERAPLEAKRPEAGDPGAVPPMASRPVETLPRRTMVPYGSADPSRTTIGSINGLENSGLRYEVASGIAMSRDGSEGWAVGSGRAPDDRPTTMTLQRFDGARWTRCAIDGLGGAHEPDPACASLDSLPLGEEPNPVSLYSIARVPLEHDDDPSNDDEFAAVAMAVGSEAGTANQTKMLSYRDGVWKVDKDASEQIVTNLSHRSPSIAFTSPGDGWLLTNNLVQSGETELYHYGGGDWPNGRWVECTSEATEPECAGLPELLGSVGNAAGGGLREASLQVAGDAILVAGTRYSTTTTSKYPAVFAKPPSRPWTAEYDPGQGNTGPIGAAGASVRLDELAGTVDSLSAVDLGDGRVSGWLVGKLGKRKPSGTVGGFSGRSDDYLSAAGGPQVLMRRDPDKPIGSPGAWSFREAKDAAEDFLPFARGHGDPPRSMVSFVGEDGRESTYMSSSGGLVMRTYHPPLEYDAAKDRWQVMPAPFVSSTNAGTGLAPSLQGEITAMAPDGQGGAWVAARGNHTQVDSVSELNGGKHGDMASHKATMYYHYTDRRPKAVFEDSPSPVTERITDLDGTRDGTVWVSTETERLYRYDRIAGWERVSIPEWDPGRVVTKRSKAFALAVNDQGHGIVVGEQGRIANLSPEGVALDGASANRCSDRPPPCGTPRDLRAAAVSPDGSAMAGGEGLTMSWRPAGGHFRSVDAPRSSASATVTDISMPDPTRAWVTLDNGEIWAGELVDPAGPRPWRWVRESDTSAARDEAPTRGVIARLFGVEVDGEGRGLAVGARGAMLERSPDGSWKRLVTGFLDNFYSVELPPQGYGDGTLVGGWLGVILTRSDGRFHIARPADRFDPLTSNSHEYYSARINGVAISGGTEEGDTEAWAASQLNPDGTGDADRSQPNALLHFASSDDPLLDPQKRSEPLADSPPQRLDEVAVAAFGRSDCQIGSTSSFEREGCPIFAGTKIVNEVISRRIRDEIAERAERSGAPTVAAFTGDINDAAGREDREVGLPIGVGYAHTTDQPNVAHHRWKELIADPLLDSGVSMVGTVGERDLSRARSSDQPSGYHDPRELAATGVPIQWREAFGEMPAPWGSGDAFSSEVHEYRPVPGSAVAPEYPDQKVEDPTKPVPDQTVEDPTKGTEDPTVTPPPPAAERTVPLPRPGDQKGPPRVGDNAVKTAGAHTHYALDVVRKSDDKALSRIIVADSSNLRSLAASDANQNPAEPQQGWLEQVLCFAGSPADTSAVDCSRPEGLPAVVVTTTPTYSYGPGAVEQTLQESASFEALLLRHKATALISGHMGWNGLYYTFAPGLHFPQPGGEHPDSTNPPTGPGDDRGPDPSDLPVEVPDQGDISGDNAVTAFPTVIASSAGSLFGPRGEDTGSGSQGFWHGYSVIRVPPRDDPDRKVIVEQRPILDWINITAKSHVLRPQQRLNLDGVGREPLGTDSLENRFNEIDSPAITHCYDLLLADPDKPWRPLEAEDASEEQLAAQGEGCPSREPTSSQLQAESAEDEDSADAGPCTPYVCLPTSIGTIDHQTGDVRAGGGQQERTFGIAVLSVGEQTATWPIAFEPRPSFSPPRVPPPPPPPPPVPPTPPPPPPVGTVGNFNLPTPPALPSLPLGAELVPPAPPIPPPPPGAANVAPLNLFLSTPGINIAPQSTVIPPPAPPIQPAPPGGARKEARQRQAAAQKSGSEVARDESADGAGDLAQTPNETGTAMTRHESNMRRTDRVAPGQSFTPLTHRHQPSAWATGLQWGGGMTLMALVLAFGWTTIRPGPRRRLPEVPAPAWTRSYRRGRR